MLAVRGSANALKASGVGEGDRVAVLTKNRAEYFELILHAVRSARSWLD